METCHCGQVVMIECKECSVSVCFQHARECNGCEDDFCDMCLINFDNPLECMCSECFGDQSSESSNEARKPPSEPDQKPHQSKMLRALGTKVSKKDWARPNPGRSNEVRSKSLRALGTKVSIVGLDRLELLKALWEAQKVNVMVLAFAKVEPEWNKDDALRVLQTHTHIVAFRGRTIEMDLSKDEIDSTLYDKIAGEGTAAGVIDTIRNRTFFDKILAWMR